MKIWIAVYIQLTGWLVCLKPKWLDWVAMPNVSGKLGGAYYVPIKLKLGV